MEKETITKDELKLANMLKEKFPQKEERENALGIALLGRKYKFTTQIIEFMEKNPNKTLEDIYFYVLSFNEK